MEEQYEYGINVRANRRVDRDMVIDIAYRKCKGNVINDCTAYVKE